MSEQKFELVGYDLYYSPGGPNRSYTVVEGSINSGNYGCQCLRCKQVTPLRECSNCGGASYEVGANNDRTNTGIGLFCQTCDRGFTSVTCGSCGTQNPVTKTFGEFKSGACFVATVTFGGFDAPEVRFLRAFRDEKLVDTSYGASFVRSYYKFGPHLANVVDQSPILKWVSRHVVLATIISILKLVYPQKKDN